MTIKQVAQAIGVSVSTYREWEYGRAIKGEPYLALAEVLGVSVMELLSGRSPAMSPLQAELEAIKKHLVQLERELALLF